MKISQQEKIYQIALSNIDGIGVVLFKKLLQQFGSAESVFANSKEVRYFPSIRKTVISSLQHKDTISNAERIFEKHVNKKIQIVCHGEASYPKRLSETSHAPAILYCSNQIDFNLPKVLSIVGSRNATPYGKSMVKRLIEELSVYDDLLLVSGLAYGIDIHAHISAIEANIATVGVIAGGLNTLYPVCHEKVALQMMKKGGIVSEQILGVLPEKHHFPLRNRVIAGMADACIIVEAGKKSGALITANFSNQYNREVFAVPGSIGNIYSEGCNSLIKQHAAHLLTEAKDIVDIMNWSKKSITRKKNQSFLSSNLQLTQEEICAVNVLSKLNDFVDIDSLSEKTNIDSDRLSSITLELELKNIVEVSAGNKYRLKGI